MVISRFQQKLSRKSQKTAQAAKYSSKISINFNVLINSSITIWESALQSITVVTAGILNSVFAAATFSLLLSVVTVFGLWWFSGAPTRPAQLFELPWWAGFGGLIGAVFVSGGAMLVPVMGAAAFFVCLIAGQLVGSVLADTFGAFGLEQRVLSVRKLAGVALAFAGVVLVR